MLQVYVRFTGRLDDLICAVAATAAVGVGVLVGNYSCCGVGGV